MEDKKAIVDGLFEDSTFFSESSLKSPHFLIYKAREGELAIKFDNEEDCEEIYNKWG